MSHPPIPPKSKLFFQGPDYIGSIIWWFRLAGDRQLNMGRFEWLHTERLIVGSVAECEWRRRAERWHKVVDHFSCGGMLDNYPRKGKGQWFYMGINREAECLNYARMWKEWGQAKKVAVKSFE